MPASFNKLFDPAYAGGGSLNAASHFSVATGWKVREDGDVEMANGDVIPLEDFIESGRMDGLQASIAREIKARWESKD